MSVPRILLVAMLLATACRPAAAAIVAVDFQGRLTSVAAALTGTFSSGQAFTGSYRYDTTTPVIPTSNPSWVGYSYIDFSLTIGSLTLSANGTPGPFIGNAVQILDGVGGFDTIAIDSTNYVGGPYVLNGLTVMITRFQLTSAGNPLQGIGLPTAAPVLSDYSFNRSILMTLRPNPFSLDGQDFIRGEITDLRPGTTVPEPPGVAMLLAGITGLLALRRRS